MDQLQEHWDYEMGCQTELQNAYQRSSIERPQGDDALIEKLVEQGKFVVVYYAEYCCPRTDAFICEVSRILKIYDNREAAEAHYREIMEGDDYSVYAVMPPKPSPYTAPMVEDYGTDDIPF